MRKHTRTEFTRLLQVSQRCWSQYSIARRECLADARIKMPWTYLYTCKKCRGVFQKNEVQVDHINPLGVSNPRDIEEYCLIVTKLYCSKNMLQVLCKPCHKIKTQRERKEKKNAVH